MNFIEGIKEVFKRNVRDFEEDDCEYRFTYYDKLFVISKGEVNSLYEKFNGVSIDDELSLYNTNYYECLVEESGPVTKDDIEIIDTANEIVYKLGEVSDEYIIFLFERVFTQPIDYRRKLMALNSMAIRRYVEETDNVMDLLRIHLRRFITLKIISQSSSSLNEYKTKVDAFLFNVSYNTKYSLAQVKYTDEFFGRRRRGNRRISIEDIEAPKRKYISDLVYHYQMGLSTFQPALQFISYYHIMEHFFQKVYYEDLVNTIREELTSPRFSAKKDSEINKLIKTIKKKIRIDNENNSVKSESEALYLTLINYVDLDVLKEDLNEVDSNLLDYYSNNTVEFSNGPKVNFTLDNEGVFKQISNRIYKTRNAVIHSKSDDKERYIPFRHESKLLKEIPLLQVIAEQIVIKTSKLL